jgi:serine/threonine-protein kinase
MADAPVPDRALERIGKYEVRGVLGRGAMGVVYDGWDPMIERRVAIKTARLPDPDDVEAQEEMGRFRREAQAAGRLSHPNIVGVYDSGEIADAGSGGAAFFVMELVEGQTLRDMLQREQRMAVGDVVSIMEEVLAGLNYSHKRGVIHRDIKPANIMVTHSGQAKIADFGIARIESSSMTQAGTMMGTPAYMSPEQFMGQTVDSRTDIYSAGVLLYQLLTGERPFEGSITAIMHKALNTTPPAPSALSVTVTPAIDAVVARAMARRPEDRFATAAEFATALRAAYEAPEPARPPPPHDDDATMIAPSIRDFRPPPPPPPAAPAAEPSRPRSKAPLAIAGAAALLALAGAGAWFALSGGPAPAPPPKVADAAPPPPVQLPVQLPDAPAKPEATQPASAPQQTAAADLPALRTPGDGPAALRPTPAASAPPNPAAVRAAVAGSLRHAQCSIPEPAVEGDALAIRGLTGLDGAVADDLIQSLAKPAAEGVPVKLELTPVGSRYCRAIDLVRETALAPGAPTLTLAMRNGVTRLQEDDLIVPMLTLPDMPTYLRVDYLSSDGSVYHIYPGAKDLDRPLPAGTSWQPKAGVEAAPPFGRDVIVAVASSAPLLPSCRKDSEASADAYMTALQNGMDSARQRGVRLAARAVQLDIVPKKAPQP